jgi:hypothetical protein
VATLSEVVRTRVALVRTGHVLGPTRGENAAPRHAHRPPTPARGPLAGEKGGNGRRQSANEERAMRAPKGRRLTQRRAAPWIRRTPVPIFRANGPTGCLESPGNCWPVWPKDIIYRGRYYQGVALRWINGWAFGACHLLGRREPRNTRMTRNQAVIFRAFRVFRSLSGRCARRPRPVSSLSARLKSGGRPGSQSNSKIAGKSP